MKRDYFTRSGKPISQHVVSWAKATRAGKMDRREFLALATTFGATAVTAYGMLGLGVPRQAFAAGRKGGTLRVSMKCLDIKDPRSYDWAERGNIARPFCEGLARWGYDFSFQPWLLEDWEVSDDASEYILKVRKGATWTNGDVFTLSLIHI